MSRPLARAPLWACLTLPLPLCAQPVDTLEPPPVTWLVQHKVTLQSGYGPQDGVLGNDREDFHSLRYEPSFSWFSPEQRWARWQAFGRAWLNYDSSTTVSTLDETTPQRDAGERPEGAYAELRELYLRRSLIGDDPRYWATFGRQSYYDRYGIWWDASLESLRLDYSDTFSRGFLAVGQKFWNYNSDVNSLAAAEEDIRYAFGEFAWRWRPRDWAGLRLLREDDHSGRDAQDERDFRGWRAGLFVDGEGHAGAISDYHLELARLDGRTRTPDGQTRTTRGWAALGELGRRLPELPWQPRLALRAGLTDRPGEADRAGADGFYLNAIQSDRHVDPERYNSRLVSSFLNLDLRNLAFYGLAVETQPTARTVLDLRLSDLYLRNASGDLPLRVDREQRSARQAAIAAGSHDQARHLGQVLDLTHRWQMFPLAHRGRHLNFNTLLTASYFRAGPAIDNGDDCQLTLALVMRY